jgi:NitT/TauT family transport system substrate-binding protein
MIARSKDLPVQILTQGVQAAPSIDESWDGLVVKASSPIKAPKDLAGKKIAVNALANMNELAIRSVLTPTWPSAS